ncbi:MAG: acyl-CoA dehydrogenase family protein, partial [Mycobacterium sp.]
ATVERVKVVEASEERFDRQLWAELAKANLLGIAIPEEWGGSGFGILELCLLVEQQGRRVAPVPLLPTVLVSAMALAEHGSREQQATWLPGVASGSTVLTAALTEAGANEPLRPRVSASPDSTGWRLDGTKVCVPAAHVAARVLVPARTVSGTGVFMVDPQGPGVAIQRAETTNHEAQSHLVFDGVPVASNEVIGDPAAGGAVVDSMVSHALLGLCAIQLGVAEEALSMAASYTAERQQFGRALATNQSVAQKAADAYIDVEAMRVTMLQAAWRMTTGRDATQEVLVSKWWASEAGQRVVHTAQHLHGGVGADVEYPVHRYFLWGKQIENSLGGASQQLERIGQAIAAGARA